MKIKHLILLTIPFLLLIAPTQTLAYIGPGAGFALVSSFFILIIAVLLAAFTILTLPMRTVYLFFKRRKSRKNMKAGRVIVLGFDGLDPLLCRQYIDEGKLPNLAKLETSGSFKHLATTTPSISPVAWSTFATGVNPGKHKIFDFFTRNPRNYQPILSSALISSRKRLRSFGPFKFPSIKSTVKLLRKSTSFWQILGQHKIFSTVLRVPITFPPEKFYGACLSAMCAPDLRGTQGSFTQFTTEPHKEGQKGTIVNLSLQNNKFSTEIPGPNLDPKYPDKTLTIALQGRIDPASKVLHLQIADETITIAFKEYSPWINLEFKAGFRKKVSGIARFLLTDLEPHLKIYMTPININPERPSLPISHPFYYSICLAKLHGPFATLGLAEDTWALNEEIIDEQAFLTQAYDIWQERETAFLDNLKKSPEGLLVNVFDTTDRIQHMFFRYLDDDHPANLGKDTLTHKHAIAEVYQRADQLTGKVLGEMKKNDVLFVISDHGFKPFKWGVNLNTWLWQEGYLKLKDGAEPGKEWFADVDWQQTKAFAFGLAGIFINTKGREKMGIVKPGKEREQLLAELQEKLESITDDSSPNRPINRAIIADQILKGPYVKEAPDIFPGYSEGYRVSWNSAVGKITSKVIEPNTKHWSGDHCLDPELVPGVIFSNWKIEDNTPALMDMAPTILDIFGLPKPKFQDGKVLKVSNQRIRQ